MKFDQIVITAANEAQARGYRAQTAGDARVTVIPDPGGRRVGSLGATVNALRQISAGGNVLICHSGGDARRTPGYAAMGKAFVPMRDGRPMFAHIVETMENLAVPRAGGLLVVSGDVLLTFDFAAADFSRPGVTGVAYPDGPAEARRHGVYRLARGDGNGPGARPVADFLQKPAVSKGRWLIDTGILFIDWPTARKMKKLPVAGDIYEEFPRQLLGGFAPFHVNVLPSCEFFHIGSSRELLDRLGDGRTYVDAVACPLTLAGGNIVTNVPPGRFASLSLGPGECLTCLPLGRDRWYDLRYRLDDNFKTDGLWEKHALAAKMKEVDHARLLAARADAARARVFRVERPLRIDLAGGWSDTPPICYEQGGRVLNAAVTLEGCRPVVAEVRRIDAREVRVESVDLGERGVLTRRCDIYGAKDPHDWCALVKSALAVTGYSFDYGGLDIRIFADVPKGSGLGTSSILGAALVEALLSAAGKAHDADTVAETTLRLEQTMCTGGGWEDQLGALSPGVKLIETAKGREQHFRVKRLPPKAEAAFTQFLQERSVLYFTGQKRMARDVLRGVLAFYAANPDGIAHAIVSALKRDAAASFRALKNCDWRAFTAGLNAYWMHKKALDPGSTNAQVESIIARISPWTEAVTLAGAGGGGFLFAIAKSKSAKKKMEAVLAAAGNGGRCYRFRIDTGT
jgi:galactokinase/mevalonate kinase-like predicted kinase